MKFVKIHPPGTWCTHEALRDVIRRTRPRTFVDMGCGAGDLSKFLCSLGLTGVGVDFSRLAIDTSSQTLRKEIEAGKYQLVEGDAAVLDCSITPSDIAISCMVMEHVEDDVSFISTLAKFVAPDSHVCVCVPGRKDHWSFEDETVGHFRRYDRDDLRRVMEVAGLREVQIWSVAVPTANVLFRISDWLVRNSNEIHKLGQSQREQTETSGVREIPWKTVFPSWVRLILNRYTLYPLFVVQRLFYRTGLGVIMLGFGRVAKDDRQGVAATSQPSGR